MTGKSELREQLRELQARHEEYVRTHPYRDYGDVAAQVTEAVREAKAGEQVRIDAAIAHNADTAQRCIQEADARTVAARVERDRLRAERDRLRGEAVLARQQHDATEQRLRARVERCEAELRCGTLTDSGSDFWRAEVRHREAQTRSAQERAGRLSRQLTELTEKHRKLKKGDATKDRRIGTLTEQVQAADRRAAHAKDVEPGTLLLLATDPGKRAWFSVERVQVVREPGTGYSATPPPWLQATITLKPANSMDAAAEAIARAMEIPAHLLHRTGGRSQGRMAQAGAYALGLHGGTGPFGPSLGTVTPRLADALAALRTTLGVPLRTAYHDLVEQAVRELTGAERAEQQAAERARADVLGVIAHELRMDGMRAVTGNGCALAIRELRDKRDAEHARADALYLQLAKVERKLQRMANAPRAQTVTVHADDQLRRELASARQREADYRCDSDLARRVAVWAFAMTPRAPVLPAVLGGGPARCDWSYVHMAYKRAVDAEADLCDEL